MFHVRPYVHSNRDFVLSLAPRLAIGMQPWRDLELWLKAVEGWITNSMDQHGRKSMVWIAEDQQGERLGFATMPVGLIAPDPADLFHQRATVDRLLRAIPGAVELGAFPHPFATGFSQARPGFCRAVAEFIQE